jgi:hypothetical protein
MKMRAVVTVVTVLLWGLASMAVSQVEMISNGTVYIRNTGNATRVTYNYGDLQLLGGNAGTWYGALTANQATINGNTTMLGGLKVIGNKSFFQPHPTDVTKFIIYFAAESGEALTITRGTARTVNGEATVSLPEHFSLVTSSEAPLTVILTPEGAPTLLYTKQKSKEKIVVAMKRSDFETFRDVEFSYQVTGVRDGFERQEVIVNENKLNEPVRVREDVQRRIDAYVGKMRAQQERKAENGRGGAGAE